MDNIGRLLKYERITPNRVASVARSNSSCRGLTVMARDVHLPNILAPNLVKLNFVNLMRFRVRVLS